MYLTWRGQTRGQDERAERAFGARARAPLAPFGPLARPATSRQTPWNDQFARVSSQPLARGRRREWENRWRPCPVRLAAPQHAPSHTHPSLARLSSAPKTSINHYKGHVYHAHPERHSAGRNSLQVQGQTVGEFACFILHARQYQSPPPLLITLGHRLPCHLVLTTCLTLPGDWELNVDKVWAVPYDRAYL